MLSVICRVSVCGPKAVGEKFTVIVQDALDASVEPHVLEEIENCEPVARPTEILDRVPVFVFLRVTAVPAELLPVPCVPKLSDAGDGTPHTLLRLWPKLASVAPL